jgi:uncharacterized protein YcbK (DUF882 family)
MDQRIMKHTLVPAQEWTRRSFLGLGAAAVGAALLPAPAYATAGEVAQKPSRVLSFFNIHTNERLTAAYWSAGVYNPEALERINTLLRDYRANEIKAIDKSLLDLLHELHAALGVEQPFHVISGYRSPQTNAMLRARGGKDSGVASGSLHMEGKAIDIRVPGIDLDELRRAARALKRGGVGYYPSSNFVHVDTGRVRFW